MPCRAGGCCIAEEPNAPLAGLAKGSNQKPLDFKYQQPQPAVFPCLQDQRLLPGRDAGL